MYHWDKCLHKCIKTTMTTCLLVFMSFCYFGTKSCRCAGLLLCLLCLSVPGWARLSIFSFVVRGVGSCFLLDHGVKSVSVGASVCDVCWSVSVGDEIIYEMNHILNCGYEINIVYVIESAAYGVIFTSCLCENPNGRVRAFHTNNE